MATYLGRNSLNVISRSPYINSRPLLASRQQNTLNCPNKQLPLRIFARHQSSKTTKKSKTMSVPATTNPTSGLWMNSKIKKMHYGSGTVEKYLLSCLPTPESKAFIITGSSLANKTPLIKQVEQLLGSHHIRTFSDIKQHAPVADLDRATDLILKDPHIDTLISVGGGSPIDSAKVISYRLHEQSGKWLYHIAIPTTLSAAEVTGAGGYTSSDGLKVAVRRPECVPDVVLYDARFAAQTPAKLWLSTGLRALDHAVESMYHDTATEVPARQMALQAISNLFVYLPRCQREPGNEETITQLQLASFASLAFLGLNTGAGGLGLSHTLGYALGSPYGIPHGIASCITLGPVVKLKAKLDPVSAGQTARILPFIGLSRTGDDVRDAETVGDEIIRLVERLGLKTPLTEYGVGADQVPIIVNRATRLESGELFDHIAALVKTLY